MAPVLEKKNTKHGVVWRLNGGCRDTYGNIVTSKYYRKESGIIRRRKRAVPLTMQRPAIEAVRFAERRLGREIVFTGTRRTCELQLALYKSDPNRYAPPWVGLHCQALAGDVTTEDPQLKVEVKHALEAEGFMQARPTDEPWHFSYGWSA